MAVEGGSQYPSNVFSAFSAVLGYIGAEAVTEHAFERLLWPQRYLSNCTWRNLAALALLDPMGGPLYKASIMALDEFRSQGLLEGSHHGDMLATAFLRSEPQWHTAPDERDPSRMKTTPIRNFLWFRVVRQALRRLHEKQDLRTPEIEKVEAANVVRACTFVAHLTLRSANPKSPGPRVFEASSGHSLSAVSGILTAELTAIVVAVVIGVVWRSLWAFWWMVPLLLRLLSLGFQLSREPLAQIPGVSSSPEWDYEIDCGHSRSFFMLITGPSEVVRQFLRHYGHPQRHRLREVVQIAIIVSFGCLFPLGLLCAGIWMPNDIQYVWVCYQVYVVIAMYVSRYVGGHEIATTEARLALPLSVGPCGGQVVFGRE